MVTLETNFELLKKESGINFSKKELEEVLSDLGMDLEEINEDEIKIDITAERPDMVSLQGITRVIKAYYGKKIPKYVSKKSDYKVIIEDSVNNVRPYTCCAVVKNLVFDDDKIKEIIWVQEKIHSTFGRNRKKAAIGIYPIESIKFPIRFKAEKPADFKFQPLEESQELTGLQILSKTSTGREYAHLLDGLDKFPYFIDAKDDILSMPPIINSHKTGRITKDTKDVFIECSGHDFNALSKTLNIICFMLQDMGGEIYSVNVESSKENKITPELDYEKRTITLEFVEKMTGLKLDTKECSKLLEKMMHEIVSIKNNTIEFSISPIRTDIWHDVDVVDDIVRAYGVNNIVAELPEVATYANVLPENRLKSQITNLMVGLGFNEIFTLMLTNKNDQYTKMNLDLNKQEFMKLGHVAESSIDMVRTWLLPETLKSLNNNRNKSLPQKLFEINEVVIPDSSKDVLSRTENKMSCIICDVVVDFTAIKQVLCNILDSLNIKNYTFKSEVNNSFIQGRCAKVFIEDREIAILGEISPIVLSNWELNYPACGFEMNIDLLLIELISQN